MPRLLILKLNKYQGIDSSLQRKNPAAPLSDVNQKKRCRIANLPGRSLYIRIIAHSIIGQLSVIMRKHKTTTMLRCSILVIDANC